MTVRTLSLPLRQLVLALLLLAAFACLLQCSDDDQQSDIEVRHLKIADLRTDAEILSPQAGQHVGVEFDHREPGCIGMVRYSVARDDSVIWDFQVRANQSVRFGRLGAEFAMPPAGTYLYRVVADPEDSVSEENEGNNEDTLLVRVRS
jgi:hypothetical protein